MTNEARQPVLVTGGAGYIGSHTVIELLQAGWRAQYDIDRMCADSWRWQRMNPRGYAQLTGPG